MAEKAYCGPLNWGAVTNGTRIGIKTLTQDSFGRDCSPLCLLYVQNVSSNRCYLLFPKAVQRYVVTLWGPDGRQIQMKSGKELSSYDKVVRTGLMPTQIMQVECVSIADAFSLPINGTYRLEISAKACTNVFGGERNYFLLPPANCSFEVKGSYQTQPHSSHP